MIINAIIEKDKYGYFAFVPELKGCVSQGDSFEEAKANIKEAIEYTKSITKEWLYLIIAEKFCNCRKHTACANL